MDVCRGCCSPRLRASVRPRCVYTGVDHTPCTRQNGVASDVVAASANEDRGESSYSPNAQEEWSNAYNDAGKRPRNVDSVSTIAIATSSQQGQSRGDIGGQPRVAARLPELVAALLELAAVEVGVFRRVVMFI